MEMIQGQLMYVAASFVEGVFLMFLYDFVLQNLLLLNIDLLMFYLHLLL